VKNQKKHQNGFHIPFQLSGRWIPESVSVKIKKKWIVCSVSGFCETDFTIRFGEKKKKNELCSVSGMFETDLESRFGEKLRRRPFLIFMKRIL